MHMNAKQGGAKVHMKTALSDAIVDGVSPSVFRVMGV